MKFETKLAWKKFPNFRRLERLSIDIEEFSFKPKYAFGKYLKVFGWLGIWVTYEGRFLQFFGGNSVEKR